MPVINTLGSKSARCFGFLKSSGSFLSPPNVEYLVIAGGGGGGKYYSGGGGAGGTLGASIASGIGALS